MPQSHYKCRSCGLWRNKAAFYSGDKEIGQGNHVCTYCKHGKRAKAPNRKKEAQTSQGPPYDYPVLTDFAHEFVKKALPPPKEPGVPSLTEFARRFIKWGRTTDEAFAADYGHALCEAMDLTGRTDPFMFFYFQEHGTTEDLPDFDATLYQP